MEDAEMELDDREPDDFEPEGRNVIKRVWTLEEDANPPPNPTLTLTFTFTLTIS